VVKYINFRNERPSKSGKTKIWDVTSIRDEILGEIKWFGRWRRYAFNPGPLTVFEPGCMRVIANYCEIATTRHKKK